MTIRMMMMMMMSKRKDNSKDKWKRYLSAFCVWLSHWKGRAVWSGRTKLASHRCRTRILLNPKLEMLYFVFRIQHLVSKLLASRCKCWKRWWHKCIYIRPAKVCKLENICKKSWLTTEIKQNETTSIPGITKRKRRNWNEINEKKSKKL